MENKGFLAFKKIYPEIYYDKYLTHNIRPDGRTLEKVRSTNISPNSIGTSNASSFVKLGQTTVMAGIKAQVGPSLPSNTLPICKTPFSFFLKNLHLSQLSM